MDLNMSSHLSGAVVCEQIRASQIGTDILKQGGNAADAIIATVIAVNTLAPFHSDIGGGGFAIIREPSGEYQALDFRHTAPRDVTMAFYQAGASTSVGGSAVAVPGQMKGLWELHQKYGQLKWSKLLDPSISLAEGGMEMREDLSEFTRKECVPPGSDNIAGSIYEYDPQYAFLFRKGKVIPVGEKLYRHGYAKTLRMIAERGAAAFYEGPIAQGIIDAVQAKGGLMCMEDLRDYKPIWREPIQASYRDYQLWTVPAPASGAIWLSAMGILSQSEAAEQGSVLDCHRVTEALRSAYGQRTALGDPAFVPGLDKEQKRWTDPQTCAGVAKRLSDARTFPPDYYKPAGVEIQEDAGTSNITAADSNGLVISITTTVGLNWGSKIIVPGFGFVLNDSMDDFSVKGRPNATGYEPSEANYVEPGKRPLSSSCPYIVENSQGKVIAAGGAAGGSTIISANVQVTRNILDYGMSASEALRANRLHNQVLPNVSQLERSSSHQGITVDGFPEAVASGLQEKGHKIEWVTMNRSTPCAMKLVSGSWETAGDPRKADSGGSVI